MSAPTCLNCGATGTRMPGDRGLPAWCSACGYDFDRDDHRAPELGEDLRMRLVDTSCLERDDGFPECIGAAARGEQGCTCGLHPGQHDEAVLVAWAHFHERGGKACHDCAFRRGSPEMENGLAMSIAEGDQAFYCHQGMPVDGRGCDAELGEFRPDNPRRYPPCAGLAAIRRRSSP